MSDTRPESRGLGHSFAVVILVVALFLGGMSWLHFIDGLAQEAAVPVPNFLLLQVQMPKTVYLDASHELQSANPENGDAWLVRAEAESHAGASDSSVESLLIHALSCQPASARARVLLAGLHLHAGKPELAVRDYAQAMLLAPNDYYLFAMRAEVGAGLWKRLSPDMQESTKVMVREMWQNEKLRPQIRTLLMHDAGVQLITRAFADHQEDLRALNRWMFRQSLRRR